MSERIFEVAVDAPIAKPLTYLWSPNDQEGELLRGQSVKVPLGAGQRKVSAVVLGQGEHSGEFKLKNIVERDLNRPSLPEQYIHWLEWIAKYYLHPIGQVMSLAFPPLKRATKVRKSKKAPVVPEMELSTPPELTSEQKSCVAGISGKPGFGVHLLHGVTGSGKTEVYLHLLDKTIQAGQRGLVLVPEISLTPQLLKRFSARFPGQVAVIHSHLTDREKTNQWWDMYDGKKKVLIGARSAMFCPISDLGLIILDEEHEPSFKQEEKLKYHARDAAIMLGKEMKCPVILGSATPSMETWKNVREGRYNIFEMKKRVSERHMPTIRVVDIREERKERRDQEEATEGQLPFWLSEELFGEIEKVLKNDQQAALFLNRRGTAQTVLCESCGHVYECPNCAITLTLHHKSHLVCHYCDYSEPLRDKCKECDSPDVKPLGLGTERIENDIQILFPDAKIARADRDEIHTREDLEHLIEQMENGETDILVGTQMIAKGLDFPKLNLVGLVMADVAFNLPDFRSTERSFQLVTQVSGRAGRHSKEPGMVIIQTYNPLHPSITFAMKNDFAEFADAELEMRRQLNYPPFSRLASVRIQGAHHEKVQKTCQILEYRAQSLTDTRDTYKEVQVLGPCPAPLAKLRNKYRYHMLIKSPEAQRLNAFCQQLLGDQSWIPSGTKVQFDIDPITML